MTHAEFRALHLPGPLVPLNGDHPLGLVCPGELAPIRDAAGCPMGLILDPVDGHSVELLQCAACRATVVWDASADVVRNEYHAETYAQLVQRLQTR